VRLSRAGLGPTSPSLARSASAPRRPHPILTLIAMGLAFWLARLGDRTRRPPEPNPARRRDLSESVQALQTGRGRDADSPQEIPARGWKDIVLRTWREFREDQIPMIAAGVTFYILLALFPGIGAFVALYGLVADVGEAQKDVALLSAVLPGGAITLIGDQMARVAAAREDGLSVAAFLGLATSLWSANGAMKAIITGLNIAYEETESRAFARKLVTSFGFTLGALVFAMATAAVLVAQPVVERLAGHSAAVPFALVAWSGLFALLVVGLAVLYRYGPSRDRAKWRWISWGSFFAGLAWLAVSTAFSAYVARFGSFDRTYGPLGAVIGFMTWAWISSMVVLLGAELNSEIEHQTARDSTVGPPEPLGSRGATMADTVGVAQ